MSKKLIYVLVLVLMAGFNSFAQAEWVSFDGQGQTKPQVQVTQQADNLTRLDITMSGVDSQTVAINGTDYSQVRIPGHWFTLDQGAPELPFITSSLIIPNAGTPVVRVVKSTWREIGTNAAVPSKGNMLRTEDPATVPYSFGPAYTSGGIFPAKEARLADPFIMRDFRGVSLRVHAVRWDADRGALMALESMTLEVETTGTGGINVKQARMSDGMDPEFANLYSLGFDNYDGVSKYNMLSTSGRMLVVCNDAFMSTIQPFIEWKRSTGLDVELISTGSVGGSTLGIQGAIDARYDDPAGLTYVVLVGDYAQVPCYSGTYEGADDDTRYANQEGSDLYPDLFISRISGSNPAHIETQINKFITYERNPEAGGEWYKVGAGLASNEGSPPDYTRTEWLRQDMLGYTFNEVHEIYQPSGTSTDIANAVNAGVSLVNYIGHGSGTSWSNPPFNITNVHNLSNGHMTPWIIDVACLNGDFSNSECFAEAWMRAGDPEQPDGAVAMYSASTSTPWVPPCVMQAETVDLLVGDQANIIGSLYFHGIMKMMDTYPGDSQGVEQYNIFGDCSLMVRTDTPTAPVMSHSDVIALGSTVFPVDTGVRGAKVALYSDGQLHGVGYTDDTGHVDVQLDNPVLMAGEVMMTVTGYNLMTESTTLQAIVPVVVDIQPSSIPVGVATEVTVTLADPPAAKDISNVTVTIEGYGVSGLEVITDAYGVAVFTVMPEFGETLLVRGVEDGAGYDMFGVDLPVTGAIELVNADILAEVNSIGMTGFLTPHIEGVVTGYSDISGLEMSLVGCGLDVQGSSTYNTVVMNVTPSETGIVTAALLKAGHNVYETQIDCVAAYGTIAGMVTDETNTPLAGVRVYAFNEGDDPSGEPLFDLVSASDGSFAFADELPVGNYDIFASKFGYLNQMDTFFLEFGDNHYGVTMPSAPSGVLTGTVSALEGGEALAANIRVYRSDNGDLMASVATDEYGVYTTPMLTYFDYNVVVTAYHFIPQNTEVSIASASNVKDFLLEATNGNILVINDGSTRDEMVTVAPKLGKNGIVLAEGYSAPASRASSDIVADLTTIGYTAVEVNSPGYDYAEWITYDLVIVSAGAKTSDLNSTLMTDMTTFVDGGGKLMIEGGEVAYNHQSDADFCANVLHILDWGTDNAGDVNVVDPNHAVMSVPNVVTGPLDLTYTGYGDSDSVIPAADADWPGNWTTDTNRGSVICYDPNPMPQAGQIVFFSFNYSALATGERSELLHNAVNYLLASEIGNSAITGSVQVVGAGDDSGVTVTLTPGSLSFVTGADGSYNFDGLFAGNYHLVASRTGFSTDVADVTLADGETADQNFTLNAIVTNEFCDAADVAIPDNDPDGGVYCAISIIEESILSDIGVYVDITHTYVGDMVIELISPAGTTIRLHNNQGSDADNLMGWYSTELTPYQSLDTLLGENIQGDWQLHVTDVGNQDYGHINNWCLSLTYEGSNNVSAAGDENLPQVLALNGNHPNPFNPMTAIKFSVPADQSVELAVYDVRGVRVRTLVSEVMAAGHHTVNWMGRDDSGRHVASGAYFYRLSSGGNSVVGKMLLMK